MPAGDRCRRIMGPPLMHQHQGKAETLIFQAGDAHLVTELLV